jgi:hypothetical protein
MRPTKPLVGRSVPPYDTGKVKIGLAYVPAQPWSPSRDAYNLQTALLSQSKGRGPIASRLFGFLRNFV